MPQTIASHRALADFSERAAVCASAACLAHCLLLPLLLAALPSLSAVLDIPESFHAWALAWAVPCAGMALITGWRRHRRTVLLIGGVAGLLLLAIGAFVVGETRWEVPITATGSVILATAHIVNWRWRHRPHCEYAC